MRHFDVFNGDADGLCSLQQLRLAQACDAVLVTGLKRDNALLARVPAVVGDMVTVLDISIDTNREALMHLLERGVHVQYFDHHRATSVPAHPRLEAMIDTAADVCTSVLVDRFLIGCYRAWAVVGAFGDALPDTARRLAADLGLDTAAVDQLRRLGECLNYNGYGESAADQMYRPEELYRLLHPYSDPLRFMTDEAPYARLAGQYADDLAMAMDVPALYEAGSAVVFQLPDAPWARRVVGAFANRLAAVPGRACAVLAPNGRGSFTVSLRVAAGAAISADIFALRYGGSGRLTAAGVGNLPAAAVAGLADDFVATYQGP